MKANARIRFPLGWRLGFALIPVVLLFPAAAPLRAQVDTGAILGTVTDQSGAIISGATVTLKNEGTNATLTTTSEQDGTYKFTPLKIGAYTVSGTFKGFQKTETRHVQVDVGAQVVVDLRLTPGNVTETVEVVATAPLMQSQDASLGQVMDTRNVNDLPLNGRNFTFLAQLTAGVNSPQADTRGNAASGQRPSPGAE